jgi:hypothetical protein
LQHQSYTHKIPSLSARNIALLCDDPERTSYYTSMAHQLGCNLINGDWSLQLSDSGHADPVIDLIIADHRSISDRASHELSHFARYLIRSGAEALIWTDLEMLDIVFAALPTEQCHFLVDATEAEAMLIMSGVIRRGNMKHLHDTTKESEFGALHRISDELAGFARALAKIAENDDANPSSVSDRPISFRPAPFSALMPLADQPIGFAITKDEPSEPAVSAKQLREIIKMRRVRDQYFSNDLFADPAWDILLDLFAARLEGRKVSVSSLCIAAAVPPTTALRWLTGMTENGLLERHQDPSDARRVFIALSDDSTAKLTAYFDDVRRRSSMPI